MTKKILLIIFCSLLWAKFPTVKVWAQNNKLDFGFSKFNNTWNFTGNALFNLNGDWGNFQIVNNYQGTAIEAISNSFRDDEVLFSVLNYSIYKNLFLTTEAKYNLIADKRIQDANQLKRLSGVAGVSGKIVELVDFKLLLGAEDNTQATLNSSGLLTKANAEMRNFNVDGYSFNSSLNSELLFLQDKRSSKDADFLASVSKFFSPKEMFQFTARYRLQGRDFLQFAGVNNPLAIESNLNNRIGGSLDGSWEAMKNFVFSFNGNVENITINRNFMNNYEHINFSKVARKYNELNTNLNVALDIFGENIFQKIGMMFSGKNERNIVQRRFEIDNNDFLVMQGVEAQKDNNSVITNLFYNNNIKITKNDTLRTNLSITKLEYNTPSIANKDARDEAKLISSLWYLRKCSDILSVTVNLNYLQNHLVFIKKERSSQNNWNRIITLNTGIIIRSDVLYYSPQFEVLANYTIYDFETSDNRPRSYSFRQISYRDSLRFAINEKYFLTSRIFARCSEQGKLFWASFSEVPQQRNIEISVSPMLNCELNRKVDVGLGGRLFFLRHGAISSAQPTRNTHKIYSIAPEASYSIKLRRITLSCYGWLEFRYQQEKFVGRIPNIFLQTSYNL